MRIIIIAAALTLGACETPSGMYESNETANAQMGTLMTAAAVGAAIIASQ